jgi:ubiquinone biosynthesis protein UbiJ
MSNKDLLKQAIAEAKTIREAAIANAKEALEESLTPHLKEMLAQKLQEMEDSDEEEDFGIDALTGEKLPNPADQIVAEEEEEAEEEAPEGEEEAPEGEEEAGEEEEEEVEIEDMSIDDLKDLIRDIVSQEVGQEESEEEMPGEEAPEGEEDMVSMDGDSEEIDINELLAELEGMEKDEPINEMGPEYIEGAAQLVEMFPFLTMQTASLVIGALGAAGLAGFSAIAAKVQDMALAGKFGGSAKSFAEKLQAAGGAAAKVAQNREGVEAVNEEVENIDENIDVIYELINMFPFLTNSTAQMLLGVFGAVGITGLSAIAAKIHQMAKDGAFGEKGKQIGDKLTDIGSAAASARNVSEESEELNEALKTINVLKNQLQEVNLLNAKLLYVNKVFKSNNLTEGQKVNVIAAFDKAETVKEVKLVFETVSKNVVAKPATIKEHRSFASKATGNAQTTAPKEIISEVSEQVSRWQKLAGIIK